MFVAPFSRAVSKRFSEQNIPAFSCIEESLTGLPYQKDGKLVGKLELNL